MHELVTLQDLDRARTKKRKTIEARDCLVVGTDCRSDGKKKDKDKGRGAVPFALLPSQGFCLPKGIIVGCLRLLDSYCPPE